MTHSGCNVRATSLSNSPGRHSLRDKIRVSGDPLPAAADANPANLQLSGGGLCFPTSLDKMNYRVLRMNTTPLAPASASAKEPPGSLTKMKVSHLRPMIRGSNESVSTSDVRSTNRLVTQPFPSAGGKGLGP